MLRPFRLATALGPILLTAGFGAVANAATLEGDFNTGPSLEKEAAGASLDIRFHPCKDDQSRTCASVLRAVEPNGPSGNDALPGGEPIAGFVFIRDLEARTGGKYRDGKIAAIDESVIKGRMVWYGLKIDLRPDGALNATGCLGFICPRVMIWTPLAPNGAAGPAAGAEH
jgi:hypothetical protein